MYMHLRMYYRLPFAFVVEMSSRRIQKAIQGDLFNLFVAISILFLDD